MRHTREQVLERLRAQLRQGHAIIGAGAGTGLSAKFAEVGGADLIIVYNSGRFRMAGHGSLAGILAFGDANAIVVEMGEREVLPVVKETPVIAGVMGTDPLRQIPRFLRQLDDLGYSGINNFPTVGLIDGRFRMELERTNMGFAKEVAMIGLAHDHSFFTAVYVFNPEEARAMAMAGADTIIAHMGLTVGGSIGLAAEDAMTLDEAVVGVQAIGEAAWEVSPEAILLCHGGPIATPADASYIVERTGAAGFVGASSMERLPVEVAMTETMQAFKAIPIASNGRTGASQSHRT